MNALQLITIIFIEDVTTLNMYNSFISHPQSTDDNLRKEKFRNDKIASILQVYFRISVQNAK